MFSSDTSVIGLNFGTHAILACESRLTRSDTGLVGSNRYNKKVKVYDGVWAGFSGDQGCMDYLKQVFPAVAAFVALNQPIQHMGDIVPFLVAAVNHNYGGLLDTSRIAAIVIGSVGMSPCESVVISKDQVGGFYYARQGNPFECIGSGTDRLRDFLWWNENGFDLNMGPTAAIHWAKNCIWYATQYDWRSGGAIRVVSMGQACQCHGGNTLTEWWQGNASNCRNRYYQRGPYFV